MKATFIWIMSATFLFVFIRSFIAHIREENRKEADKIIRKIRAMQCRKNSLYFYEAFAMYTEKTGKHPGTLAKLLLNSSSIITLDELFEFEETLDSQKLKKLANVRMKEISDRELGRLPPVEKEKRNL